MDTRTPEQRRRIMVAVKDRNTGPEMAVRRLLFAAGFRYRRPVAALPGRPDIVLPKWRAVVFVHGCSAIIWRRSFASCASDSTWRSSSASPWIANGSRRFPEFDPSLAEPARGSTRATARPRHPPGSAARRADWILAGGNTPGIASHRCCAPAGPRESRASRVPAGAHPLGAVVPGVLPPANFH